MSSLNRRELLGMLAATPATMLLPLAPATRERAARHAAQAINSGQAPLFFTPKEWETVRLLSDLIIPRDEVSGSATDAGVPEFIDFVMNEYRERQTPIRGGLAWLDREATSRFGRRFVECDPSQQTALLDDIAWPAKARARDGGRRGVLYPIPGSGRERVLLQQGRGEGPWLPGECVCE